MLRRFILISLAFLLTACAAGPQGLSMAPNSTLIVTRHGDRDDDNLNAKGRARAQALVAALDGMAVDGIYSPGIQRNMDTAKPLAAARDLPITRVPQEAPTGALVRDGAGKSLVWVGNKGNLATIWEDLRLTNPPPLAYGDLHIVRSDDAGAVTIERRRYGPE